MEVSMWQQEQKGKARKYLTRLKQLRVNVIGRKIILEKKLTAIKPKTKAFNAGNENATGGLVYAI